MKRYFTPPVSSLSRREFALAGLGGLSALMVNPARGQLSARKLRVAAINSIFRLRSHAYHIVGRMVYGFQKDGVHHQPDLQVVRMYNDQVPPADLGTSFCQRHGIELVKTPGAALGGAALDVDAVALICEHGD